MLSRDWMDYFVLISVLLIETCILEPMARDLIPFANLQVTGQYTYSVKIIFNFTITYNNISILPMY